MTLFDAPAEAVSMRPYQVECLAALEAAMDRGPGRKLIVLATGTGKTTIFTELIRRRRAKGTRFRALIVAHQIELLEQAAKRVRLMVPDARVGIEGGDHKAHPTCDVVVAGVQSIGRRGNTRLSWFKPDLIVVDESHHACFVAGTLVDGRPIEEIKVGDTVRAYCHQDQRVVDREVRRIWRRPAEDRLLRLHLESGDVFTCTPSHPIWDGKAYVAARFFLPGSTVYRTTRALSEPDGEGSDHELHAVRDCSRVSWPSGAEWARQRSARAGVLLTGVPGPVAVRAELGEDGSHKPTPCISKDEGTQPDAPSRFSGKDAGITASDRTQAGADGRKRSASFGGSGRASQGAWLADGGHRSDSISEGQGLTSAIPLQDRHRGRVNDDGHRSGRRQPSVEEGSRGRHAQGDSLEAVRVARVEVFERGRDAAFGDVCPDGHVYNLQVDVDKNYFIGSGILVHNCADSYQAVFDNFGVFEPGGPFLLGVTATPHRLDNKPLHGDDRAIFEEVLYSYPIRTGIRDGFLCDVRGYRALATGLNLSEVKRTAGDFNQAQLQKIMDTEEVTQAGIKSWLEVARDRRTVVFCTGVEHARNVAEAFQEIGVPAASIDGTMDSETRDAIMAGFRSGRIQVLTNMQLVTEGVDVPEIACVLLLRPTQSWALYTQMVGRGLRPAPGKPDCIIIDVVGNTEKHALGRTPPASLAGVFDLPPNLDLKGESVTEALDLFEELDEESRGVAFRRVVDMSGLRAALTQVDLLAELGTPDELTGFSTWAWMKLADDRYFLNCGSREGLQCSLEIHCTTLGEWVAQLQEGTVVQGIELGDDLRTAFSVAERAALRAWPHVGAVVDTRARWRSQPPTDQQRATLRAMGYKDEDIKRMNKGQASSALTRAFRNKRTRRSA